MVFLVQLPIPPTRLPNTFKSYALNQWNTKLCIGFHGDDDGCLRQSDFSSRKTCPPKKQQFNKSNLFYFINRVQNEWSTGGWGGNGVQGERRALFMCHSNPHPLINARKKKRLLSVNLDGEPKNKKSRAQSNSLASWARLLSTPFTIFRGVHT